MDADLRGLLILSAQIRIHPRPKLLPGNDRQPLLLPKTNDDTTKDPCLPAGRRVSSSYLRINYTS